VNRLSGVETKRTNEIVRRKMLSAPRKTKQPDSQGHILEKLATTKIKSLVGIEQIMNNEQEKDWGLR